MVSIVVRDDNCLCHKLHVDPDLYGCYDHFSFAYHYPSTYFFYLTFTTRTVNVDDAVDDVVRQFKGVSDGLRPKVVVPSPPNEASSSTFVQNLSGNANVINRHVSFYNTVGTSNSSHDNYEGHKDENDGQEEVNHANANGSHSDNELNSKSFPPQTIEQAKEPINFSSGKRHDLAAKHGTHRGGFPAASLPLISDHLEDPVGMPHEVSWL